MKTEELKSKGLTQEQIDFVMAENGKDLKQLQDDNKTLTTERDDLKKKVEAAEEKEETLQKQLKDAQDTIKGFDGVDIEKLNKDVADYKARAEKAEKDAEAKILRRDQRDYLNAEFDKLGITSERTRKSLAAEIMGEDGLKWKDGTFLGLSDFLAKENEKDHFYQTQEKKDEDEAKKKAAKEAPTQFTDKSEPKNEPPKSEPKSVPKIW